MQIEGQPKRKKNWEKEILSYAIGAMLYTPAINESVAETIRCRRFPEPYSLTLCLEDSIHDTAVQAGEQQLQKTLQSISNDLQEGRILEQNLPLLFIRVRTPRQLSALGRLFMPYHKILAGYVLPKFSLDCADSYITIIKNLNERSDSPLYMMPILESEDIIDLRTRYHCLYGIREKLEQISDLVLNIRVGGNDLCKTFKIRRHSQESIYDIQTVSHILTDILTVFSRDYIVSGPVWEYFSGENESWKKGLIKETKLDLLNGFIGKTAIHPLQIPVINSCLSVSASDYQDAQTIVNWNHSSLGVEKNGNGTRMNEFKTHLPWAKKLLLLANIYGVHNNE